MADTDVTVDLQGCARCDGPGHPGITFRKLTRAIDTGEARFSHWAPCPTNGEPILMREMDAPA